VNQVALSLSVVLVACATGEPLAVSEGASAPEGTATSSGGGGDGGVASTSGLAGAGGSEAATGGTGGSTGGCGDGLVSALEECDDANAIEGDGCSDCAIECDASSVKEPTTGHCYRLFVGAVTQPVAEANCQAWGGAVDLAHLASLGSQSENGFVAPLISGNTWIGADDFGGAWAWIDGTAFAFENWQAGEPNFPGTEHCMFADAEAKWHDHDCGDLRSAYLCERRGAGTF
jgi:cysteine-rich repeat protein